MIHWEKPATGSYFSNVNVGFICNFTKNELYRRCNVVNYAPEYL